ncbi:MAG TPA: hypothetical protein VNA16_02765, partial [Abditibacteriaceae bacterium]|nr:hypothetical protein [Abditibacteriaceae bacterium]
MVRQREKLTKLERIFFIATLLGGIVLLAAPVWWLSLEADPVVNIPAPPPLPKPNAFDYYVSAGNAITYPMDLYRAIIEPGNPSYKSANRVTLPNGKIVTRPFTLSEKESLLQQNAGALQTLRRGLTYPYREPPARSFLATFPHYASYRQLICLLILEGQVKAGRGNWNGAAYCYLDAIRFGTDVARGATNIGREMGLGHQSSGQRHLWGTVNHLTAAQARAAARRLEKIMKNDVPLSATLQEEKWMRQTALLEIFHDTDWRNKLLAFYNMENMQSGQGAQSANLHLWFVGKRTVMRNYSKLMDESIAAARRP